MRRMRRVLLVAVAAALAGAGIGCGDGGASDEVSAVAPLDLLGAVEEAGSARVSFRFEDDGFSDGLDTGTWGTLLMRAELEGVVTFGDVRTDLSGTFETAMTLPEGAVDEAPPPSAWGMDFRSVGDQTWTRETYDGEPGPWARQPTDGELDAELEEMEVEEGSDGDLLQGDAPEEDGDDPFSLLDPTSFDPMGFVEALRVVADDFAEAGSEDVRGDATTRYRVALDPSVGEDGDWYGLDGQVEVWLDAEERLRRVRGGGIEMELWDFGIPVDVEVPADAVEFDEVESFGGFGIPEVTGEWAVEAEGTTSGHGWQVFAAPAREGESSVTCRTLEIVGAEMTDDAADDWLNGDGLGSMPHHDGVFATCGSGTLGLGLGGSVADPALQVIGDQSFSMEPTGLVAFAVSERFRGAPVRVVLDGDEVVELPLDAAGLAVWDASVTATVVAVELDGGAVRCPVESMYDDVEVEGDEEYEEDFGDEDYLPTAADQLWGGVAPCVRA